MELAFEKIANEIIPSQTERVTGEVTVRITPAADGYFGIARTVIPLRGGVGTLHTDVLPDGNFTPRFLFGNRVFVTDEVRVSEGGIEPLPPSRAELIAVRRALAAQTERVGVMEDRIAALVRAVGEAVTF